jgi:uncharacterized protein (TIGR02246 family)
MPVVTFDEATSTALTPNEKAANQDLDRRFTEAMSHKDLDGVMDCFWRSSETVLVLFDGKVFRGWEEIREVVAQVFAMNDMVNLKIDEVTHLRAGDCVLAVGTATYRFIAKGSAPEILTERWTDVRRKIDGRWVYVLDHAHKV